MLLHTYCIRASTRFRIRSSAWLRTACHGASNLSRTSGSSPSTRSAPSARLSSSAHQTGVGVNGRRGVDGRPGRRRAVGWGVDERPASIISPGR
eukprot:2672127-Prymnesium_polylepis.1